jgi:hypothetical protein
MIKQFHNNIKQNMGDIFKQTRQILEDYTLNCENLAKYTYELSHLRESMYEWMILMDNLIAECRGKEAELQEEYNELNSVENPNISDSDSDKETNITHTADNIKFITIKNSGKPEKKLNWADMCDIDDSHEQCISKLDSAIEKINKPIKEFKIVSPPEYKDITHIRGVNIGNLRVPIIHDLKDISPSIYWFSGDKDNKSGLYLALTPNCYIEIPLPQTIDGTKNSNRNSSIRCKYGSLQDCQLNRENLATKYNSEIRQCHFAHKGDKYVKVGTSFRCPSIPDFGNHYGLKADLQNINIYDIRMLLMYATSDLLLSNIWLQQEALNDMVVLNNLDMCV